MGNKRFLFALTIISFLIISTFMIDSMYAKTDESASGSELLYFENYISALEDEPENRFHKAREDFFRNDLLAAAKEIRKAVAFIRVELAWATEEGKKGLLASAIELDKLAYDIEKGNITSVKEIDDAFSRAHQALAKHYQSKAAESNVRKAYKNLGKELKAAARHLNYAILWSGNKIESGLKETIKDMHIMGDKLIEGTKWVKEELDKGIEKIGHEIDRLNKKDETDTKSP